MNPRWLLNENFPEPSVKRLRAVGWDIATIAENAAGIEDEAVMAHAREESRWLATFDRDYGELVFKRGLRAPALILLLRVPSYLPEEPAEWLVRLHAEHQFQEGCFHIFDGSTIRRRRFPLSLSSRHA